MSDVSEERLEEAAVMAPLLDRVVVVLVEPRNDINIGTAVRACRNFGISRLRLVRPLRGDPAEIGISAPNAEDFIQKNIERVETLDEALEGCALVLGTSARQRRARRLYLEPRSAARHMVEFGARDQGDIAVLFGREDFGLPNEALDRCHAQITVPTNPNYSSLNLGQAVLLIVWELFRAAQEVEDERPAPRLVSPDGDHPPAHVRSIERMVDHAEVALERVGFLKEGTRHTVLATLRSIFLRAGLDTREAAIWHGIFAEIPKHLDRVDAAHERALGVSGEASAERDD